MIRFSAFLLEYLTDEQRSRFAHNKMTSKARSDTDHFFGKDNDLVHGEVTGEHQHEKSEIHKAVESHIGKELTPEDYHKGITKDHLGREVKLGRQIKDEKLRNQFASDKAREGSKVGSNFKTTTVRGTEVAGQTNSAPNKEHPTGHSWGGLSCKNVDDGVYHEKLHDEIKHGTVVHRVHNHDGKEIYRGTLQPHHNDENSVSYHLNSEYGIKHPAFTKSSEKAAKKLSGKDTNGIFTIHSKVYDDNEADYQLHHNVNLDKAINHKSEYVRIATARHPLAKDHHLDKAVNDKEEDVRKAVAENPNAKAHHIDKLIADKEQDVRASAAEHPNAKEHHIDIALKDRNKDVRYAAIRNPNANERHLDKAIDDDDKYVRIAVAEHHNAKDRHLDKAMKDKEISVRFGAAGNLNLKDHHLDKALEDNDCRVRRVAAGNPNSKDHHLTKALNDEHYSVRTAAVKHSNAQDHHLDKALNDNNPDVRSAAAAHLNAKDHHLSKALNDDNYAVRGHAVSHPNAKKHHIDKALNDDHGYIRSIAEKIKGKIL